MALEGHLFKATFREGEGNFTKVTEFLSHSEPHNTIGTMIMKYYILTLLFNHNSWDCAIRPALADFQRDMNSPSSGILICGRYANFQQPVLHFH